jgi:arylsulfatase A
VGAVREAFVWGLPTIDPSHPAASPRPSKANKSRAVKATHPTPARTCRSSPVGPAQSNRGQVSDDLIDFSDVLPTLADLGGGKLPTDRELDGRSFLPQLKGETGNPRDWVFCWYERNGKRDGKVKRYARNQTYKLYHDGNFYDVPADQLEKKNLTPGEIDTKAKEVRAQLQSVLERMFAAGKKYPYGKSVKPKKTKQKTKKQNQQNKAA